MPGAFDNSCSGGVKFDDGFTDGGGNCCGNPSLMRRSGAGVHPGVVAPATVDEQENTSPGTRPETAVTWNEEIVSKARPYPARNTVLRDFPSAQAKPRRGPMAWLLRSNQLSALTKVTGPWEPVMDLSGT